MILSKICIYCITAYAMNMNNSFMEFLFMLDML